MNLNSSKTTILGSYTFKSFKTFTRWLISCPSIGPKYLNFSDSKRLLFLSMVPLMLFSIFLNTDMHYDFYQLNLSTLEVTHSRYPQAFFHDLGHLSLTTDELLFRKAPLDNSKIVRMPDLKPLP